jgi:hypothetical protein
MLRRWGHAARRRSCVLCIRQLHDPRLRRHYSGAGLASAWTADSDERRDAIWLVHAVIFEVLRRTMQRADLMGQIETKRL